MLLDIIYDNQFMKPIINALVRRLCKKKKKG